MRRVNPQESTTVVPRVKRQRLWRIMCRSYPGLVLSTVIAACGTVEDSNEPSRLCAESVVVEVGDSVWSIAESEGIEAEIIADLNNLENPDLIHPGQRLCVVTSSQATATASVVTPSVAANGEANATVTATKDDEQLATTQTDGSSIITPGEESYIIEQNDQIYLIEEDNVDLWQLLTASLISVFLFLARVRKSRSTDSSE